MRVPLAPAFGTSARRLRRNPLLLESKAMREEPKQTRMLSIHRAILVAAGLTLWSCGSTAVLPHLVRQASAKELGIGGQHNRRSEPTSVTQREAGPDAPEGPISRATAPPVDSPNG